MVTKVAAHLVAYFAERSATRVDEPSPAKTQLAKGEASCTKPGSGRNLYSVQVALAKYGMQSECDRTAGTRYSSAHSQQLVRFC